MSFKSILLATVALQLLGDVAVAGSIETTSRIDRVSVHPDGARVTRTFEVDLPAGSSTVTVQGLPDFLAAPTLRVTAKASMPIVIVAHDLLGKEEQDAKAGKEPEGEEVEPVDPRVVEMDGLKARLDALNARQRVIGRYSEVEVWKAPERLTTEEAERAWDAVGVALSKVGRDVVEVRARIQGIEAELSAERRLAGQRAAEQRAAEKRAASARAKEGSERLAVVVEAEAEGRAAFEVSYPVERASWGVAYEATLTSSGEGGKPSLRIVRRATVQQMSGEAWKDAALTIETARLRRPAGVGDVRPVALSLVPEAPASYPRSQSSIQGGPVPSPEMSEALRRSNMDRLAIAAEQGSSAMPTVEFRSVRPLNVEARASVSAAETRGTSHGFSVPNKVTVPGDGAVRSVRLDEAATAPEVVVDVVPRQAEAAFLSARFRWTGEVPLFPGEVTLVSDGVDVGKGRLPFVPAGEEHTLGFGEDDLVKVVVGRDKGEQTDSGIINVTRTQVTDVETVLTNRHKGPVTVRIRDRVPTTDEKEIKVERRALTPAPASVAENGIVTWEKAMAPGESLKVRNAYAVSWPKARTVR